MAQPLDALASAPPRLRLALSMPVHEARGDGFTARWTDLREIAQLAEAIGFDTLYVADHLLYIEDLQQKVEPALAAKNLDYIQVLSEPALIILIGDVPDSKTRYQAEDLAKRIPGVRGVVNNLVIQTPVAKS